MNKKYESLSSHVQTLQATVTLIMDKLQQFELKHRADLSAMKAQYESLATAGSTKSIMP